MLLLLNRDTLLRAGKARGRIFYSKLRGLCVGRRGYHKEILRLGSFKGIGLQLLDAGDINLDGH